MPSFSVQLPNLRQSGAICEIALMPSEQVSNILRQQGQSVPSIKVMALIDTGASGTAISTRVVRALNLVPRGITIISTPSSDSHQTNEYDVSLLFPNNVYLPLIRAVEATLTTQNIDCLIGRDVLQGCVLIYTGYTNQFTLSF